MVLAPQSLAEEAVSEGAPGSPQPQGPGWWRASDGLWYSPEQAPGAQPPPQQPYPPDASPTGYPATPTAGLPLSSALKRLGSYLLEIVLVIVTLIIGWIVWSLVVWSRGQTPAKQLLAMRVVRADTGHYASFGTMALRELVGKVILGVIPLYTLVSAIMVAADEHHQGLWDKVASTLVVDDPDGRFGPPR